MINISYCDIELFLTIDDLFKKEIRNKNEK